MNSKLQDIVTLGADVGGKDAHIATNKHILSLRRFLREDCTTPYSDAIKEFAFVLRVDGSIQAWGKSGVYNAKLSRERPVATVDIFMPTNAWLGRESREIKEFIAIGILDAVESFAELARRVNVDLALDRLRKDVNNAKMHFLASD